MKRILVRAGMNPREVYSVDEVIKRNLIGSNSGNLIYAYGIFCALEGDERILEVDHYQAGPEEAGRINEEYDAFVVPLADAFRKEFIPKLVQLTKLIRKLKIPCIVAGVGLRAPYEPDINEKRPFDREVKKFVKTVLNHSAVVGVRGEITGSYLKRLGFREESHYRVIGCPSMYAHGKNREIGKPVLHKDMKLSLNYSVLSPPDVIELINGMLESYPDSRLVTQRLDELKLLHMKVPYKHKQNNPEYPTTPEALPYARNQVRFYINAIQWMREMQDVDLSLGGRMHGNIAAWLAGKPALFFPHDGRMRELVEFHQLPSMPAKNVDKNMKLEEIVDKADWKSSVLCQEQNFRRYTDFFACNGFNHCFSKWEEGGIFNGRTGNCKM